MTGIIYMYSNKTNGKKYIGQTLDEKSRIREHKCHANSRTDSQFAFYSAIRKYGWDNFEYEVLVRVETEDKKSLINTLNQLEVYYISKYNSYENGYNNTRGGNSPRRKPRAVLEYDLDGTLLNRYNSYMEVPGICKGNSNIYRACNSNRATFRGHIWRWEDQDLMVMPFLYGSKSKFKYLQYDLNDTLIREWESVVLLHKELGLDPSAVIKCCLYPNKFKTFHGFKWRRVPKV